MSRPLDDGPFFHGTIADLRVGAFLTAGRPSNYRLEIVMNHIYFTHGGSDCRRFSQANAARSSIEGIPCGTKEIVAVVTLGAAPKNALIAVPEPVQSSGTNGNVVTCAKSAGQQAGNPAEATVRLARPRVYDRIW